GDAKDDVSAGSSSMESLLLAVVRAAGRRGAGAPPSEARLLLRAHFMGEKAVGRRIMLRTCCTIGPFFSLSANPRARSGSLANVSNLETRSSRLSQARR